MKMVDLPGGFSTVVSNEEIQLLHLFDQSPTILKRKLDERQRELARQLSNRGVLTRTTQDGKLAYCKPSLAHIWRI
jgi:hypothetical protein